MMEQSLPMIEVVDLVKRFGDHAAVDRVSFSVSQGEVFGLLGPNGAGKSTIIKILTTLLPPTTGRAFVVGFDVTRQEMAVRRRIGYVPQALSADGNLTGYENLLVFAKLYDLPRAERTPKVRAALAFMGLQDAADKLVRTYSGGMIRRLEGVTVKLHAPAAPSGDLANTSQAGRETFPREGHPLTAIVSFIEKTFTIVWLEARKLRHDPTDLLTRAVQPALWLLIFGEVFTRIRAIPTGGVRYLDFMAPGILAQSVLFIAIFSGIAIIWERDLVIIHKFLASPTPRAALVLGKALAAEVRGLS